MAKVYVEQRDYGYWITGTRVSLDSIVQAFKWGAAPETIKRSFPVLSLEEVYGAITFYLAHEKEIDDYLQECHAVLDIQADARREQFKASKPKLYERLLRARKETKHRGDEDTIPG